MLSGFSKYQIATAVAIVFHLVGLLGILVFNCSWIAKSTPVNLLLCAALLVWTQVNKNKFFWLFALLCVTAGFAVELIGVHTGRLFGNYSYGTVLGVKWNDVPLIIGINWFIVMYCCGITMHHLLSRVMKSAGEGFKAPSAIIKALSVIVDSATLATIFDWLIEPVAVKLGFWQWEKGVIPLYNYACWFFISLLLQWLFHFCSFHRQNKFAVHLLLIQLMFFLLLRTFL